MRQIYVTVRCLSHLSQQQVCCCGSGGQEISIVARPRKPTIPATVDGKFITDHPRLDAVRVVSRMFNSELDQFAALCVHVTASTNLNDTRTTNIMYSRLTSRASYMYNITALTIVQSGGALINKHTRQPYCAD